MFTSYIKSKNSENNNKIQYLLSGFFPSDSSNEGKFALSSFLVAIEDVNKIFRDFSNDNPSEIKNQFEGLSETLKSKTIEIIPVWNQTICDPGSALVGLFEQNPEKLLGVVGGGCSEVTLSLSDLAHYYDLSVVSWGYSSILVTNPVQYNNLFRVIPTYSKMALKWIFLCEKFSWNRVSIVYSSDRDMLVLAHYFIELCESNLIEVVTKHLYQEPTIEKSLNEIKDQKSKIIFVCVNSTEASVIFLKAKSQKLTEKGYAWIGLDSWTTSPFKTVSVGSALGSISIVPYISSKSFENISTRTVLNCNQLFHNDDVCRQASTSPHAAFTYDTVFVYFYSILHLLASGIDPMSNLIEFREIISETNFEGLSGNVSFISTGDREFSSWKVSNYVKNKWVVSGIIHEDGYYEDIQPIIWHGKTTVTPSSEIEIETKSKSPSLVFVSISMASASLLYGVILLFLVIYHRSQVVIQVSSVLFNSLTILGCLLSITVTFLFIEQPTDETCLSSFYIIHVAFWMIFGPISLKTYRLSKAVNDHSLRASGISDLRLLFYLFIAIGTTISYVSLWNFIDPIHRRVITNQSETQQWYVCSSTSPWAIVISAFEIIFQICIGYLAWRVRKVKFSVKESIHIISVIGSCLMVILTLNFLLIIVPESPNTNFTSIVLNNLTTPFIVLTGLFVPKLYIIYKKQTSRPAGSITRVATTSPTNHSFDSRTPYDSESYDSEDEIVYDYEGNEIIRDIEMKKITKSKPSRPPSSSTPPPVSAATTTTTTITSVSTSPTLLSPISSPSNEDFPEPSSPRSELTNSQGSIGEKRHFFSKSHHFSHPPFKPLVEEQIEFHEEGKTEENIQNQNVHSKEQPNRNTTTVIGSGQPKERKEKKERKKRSENKLFVSFANDVNEFLQEY